MKKLFFTLSFLMPCIIQIMAENVITMTTDKKPGDNIKLRITTDKEQQISIDGVEEKDYDTEGKAKTYKLTKSTITITGEVRTLDCGHNDLTTLNVSGHTTITSLSCQHNKLTTLNATNNPNLNFIVCNNNAITVLDVTTLPALNSLKCHENKLTSLDMSGNKELFELICTKNNIKGTEMDKLIASLPTIDHKKADKRKYYFKVIYLAETTKEKNVCTSAQVAVAKAKNWAVQAFKNAEEQWTDYEGSAATGIEDLKADTQAERNAPVYNLSGQPVGKNYKGIVIQGGKKKIQK